MTVVLNVLLFLHMIGWAIVLGATLAGLRGPTLYSGTFHAAVTALVTGVAMVLVIELWLDDYYRADDPSFPAWVAVKLILAAGITALVWIGHRKPERVSRLLLGGIAGLTVLNVAVATLWP
jgi:predicted membrane protein